MSIKTFVVLGSAFVVAAAFAQTPPPSLGTVGNVQGLVTDTEGASVSSTVQGEAIHDGERFVTSSSGTVTLQLNNGCTITLQPNQAITIDKNMTCRALVASVEPVAGPLTGLNAPGFFASGSPVAGLAAIGGLTIARYAIHRGLDGNPNLSGR